MNCEHIKSGAAEISDSGLCGFCWKERCERSEAKLNETEIQNIGYGYAIQTLRFNMGLSNDSTDVRECLMKFQAEKGQREKAEAACVQLEVKLSDEASIREHYRLLFLKSEAEVAEMRKQAGNLKTCVDMEYDARLEAVNRMEKAEAGMVAMRGMVESAIRGRMSFDKSDHDCLFRLREEGKRAIAKVVTITKGRRSFSKVLGLSISHGQGWLSPDKARILVRALGLIALADENVAMVSGLKEIAQEALDKSKATQ